MSTHAAVLDGGANLAQRRRTEENVLEETKGEGRGVRRWRVHSAVAGGAAAALVAVWCTVAVCAPFSARPRHGTQLLQWFGLAQGTPDEGRAPDSGNMMARTLGLREGTIPKVS